MADDSTATTTDATPTGDADVTVQVSKPADDVPPEVKAALRKANKEAETLRLRLKEFEDRDKSEAERAAERLAAAEKAAADAQRDALRFKIAAKFGVTDEDTELFLTGADEETLTKQAQRLVGRDSERKKQGNHVPREGHSPTTVTSDERTFVRGLFGGGS